jgi:DNA helicase MCM8
LVIADTGVCCIDEFDKLTAQHSALLETMEQQSISIAKAGIVCTLNARTSIIAAANPNGGSYNRHKSIKENVKLSEALLSRFDLIYILLDNPETSDDLIAKHVIQLHTNDQDNQLSTTTRGRRRTVTFQDQPLIERLQATTTQDKTAMLTQIQMKKYIAYAKHYCHPELSREACQILQRCYLDMRKKASNDQLPVTNRQLESLIRLSTARAKSELRGLVTAQDANDVVSLVKDSMSDLTHKSEQQQHIILQHTISLNKKTKTLIPHLHKVADTRRNAFFTLSQLSEEARRAGLQLVGIDFTDLISTLNEQCFLLIKPGGYLLQQKTYTHTRR